MTTCGARGKNQTGPDDWYRRRGRQAYPCDVRETGPFDEIVGLLVTTAQAHHAATGGVNPKWAAWYAEHLHTDLSRVLSADIEPDELENWLINADRRFRDEAQSVSWPKAYAGWLVADYG